jgi:hypothetical protein
MVPPEAVVQTRGLEPFPQFTVIIGSVRSGGDGNGRSLYTKPGGA